MTTIFDSFLDQALRSVSLTPPPGAKRRRPISIPTDPLAGRYARFISIDLRHGYYNRSGGVCPDIAIQPTSRTAERLKLYGYIVRRRPDGIDLFWDAAVKAQANGIFAALRKRLGEVPPDVWSRLFDPPLLFTLNLANPRFGVFTEMPSDFRIGDPPLRLSTRRNLPGEDGRATLTIDWNERVDRPSIVESRGMEGLGTSKPPADDGKDDGADAGDAVPASQQGPAAQERMQIEARSQAFALLDLHFTPADCAEDESPAGMAVELSPTKPRSGPPDFFRPITYTVQFSARQTRWRYFVAARSGTLDAASLSVVGPDGSDAGFRLDDAPHRLPDGRLAACLAGGDPRAILASSQAQLALLGRPLGGRSYVRTLVDRLPAPATDGIVPAPAPRDGQPPPAWSDIYVFV